MSALSVYFVVGEASGDALAADLLEWLRADGPVDAMGLAGPRLSQLGVQSLFDVEDVAVMGITAVAARFPKIVRRVWQTVDDILKRRPDVIVLVDSPDFTHAVAKRVRRKWPAAKVVNYVCPSVWAWRQGRAAAMRGYVDHVLALLPFEPGLLAELGGPPATYVGHPLAASVPDRIIGKLPKAPRLLVLPGSRGGELKAMLPLFRDTLALLDARGVRFDAVLPAVARHERQIRDHLEGWPVRPAIVPASENPGQFAKADAALACSGTVTLELAMHRVPMTTAYILDGVAAPVARMLVKTWTGLLPNLVADRHFVPEDVNEMARPERVARRLHDLLEAGPAREAQLAGFQTVRDRMATREPAGKAAARAVQAVAAGEGPAA